MSLPEPEDPAAADPDAAAQPADLPVMPVPDVQAVTGTDALPAEQPAPPRRRRRRVIALAIAVPLVLAGGTLGTLALLGVFDKPKPPHLTAVQEKRIAAEVD